MKSSAKYDLDALLELPEMKALIAEVREVNGQILVEMVRAFNDVPKGDIPDMSYIDDVYDPKLDELRRQIVELARAHSS